ncbi:MAG: hypothetical protein OQK73_08600 [Gammaproteobacteria bacterium]|nr:hypothetical protein [Gammaproteobacteria bacterium]
MGCFVDWQDSWNTGILDLDDQHHSLAQKLNDIFELVCRSIEVPAIDPGNEELKLQLDDFLVHTREHFHCE